MAVLDDILPLVSLNLHDFADPDTGDKMDPDTGDKMDPDTGNKMDPNTGDKMDPDTQDKLDPDPSAEVYHIFLKNPTEGNKFWKQT